MRNGLLIVALAVGLLVTGFVLRPEGAFYSGVAPVDAPNGDQAQTDAVVEDEVAPSDVAEESLDE